jgi:glycosyltransferase involved in cell wall biosynthesis
VWALSSHTENFGLAVVEALAAGRAAVVSDAVNIAPEIAEAGAGVVAPPEAEPFADAITALLLADEERARLGSAARTFARRYDWSAVGAEFANMYRLAVAHRTPKLPDLENAAPRATRSTTREARR